jgi:predicted amidohydrolase
MDRQGIAAVAAPFGRDLDASFARIERHLAEARARGAGMVVFPESALGGYLREPSPRERSSDGSADLLPPSLDPDGPEIARLIALAGDTVLCVGYTEATTDGSGRYGAAVCLSGDGVLGRQRKVHLPPAERFTYTPGSGFAAFDTPVGRVGMLLCYDKLFPEAARTLATDGAQVIACMAAWPADRHRPAPRIEDDRQSLHFDSVDTTRAIENQVVWVSSNQTGRWGRLRFLGRAKVVDPDGRTLAATGHRTGVAVARVDPAAAIEDSKLFIDHLIDRRPSAYLGPISREGTAGDVLGVPH